MTPPKRHGGRVTPKKTVVPPIVPRPLDIDEFARGAYRPHASVSEAAQTSPVAATARYTPPARRPIRFRPDWHKPVGVATMVAGLGLFMVCALNVLGIHRYGGHIWYIVGLAIAASSLWWWGALDPAE